MLSNEERALADDPIIAEELPAPKRRWGHNKGITKEQKPKLSNRLPRERGALIVPAGDCLTPFERALMVLGSRVKETKMHYTLDGRACNTDDIMRAAGVQRGR